MSKRHIIYKYLLRLTFFLFLAVLIVGCSSEDTIQYRTLQCEDQKWRDERERAMSGRYIKSDNSTEEKLWNDDKEQQEKRKMEALAQSNKPTTQTNSSEEIAPYEDEPEQTSTSTEKKYLNIAGRWTGTYVVTDHTGPEYGGVGYEYGNNEELTLSVNQASNSDQATVTLWGTACTTTFNSENRKLEFTYNSYLEGSLIATVFKGTVASDLSTIEGTHVTTWPDGTQFKGTWRVNR